MSLGIDKLEANIPGRKIPGAKDIPFVFPYKNFIEGSAGIMVGNNGKCNPFIGGPDKVGGNKVETPPTIGLPLVKFNGGVSVIGLSLK